LIRHHLAATTFQCVSVAALLLLLSACKSPTRINGLTDRFLYTPTPAASYADRSIPTHFTAPLTTAPTNPVPDIEDLAVNPSPLQSQYPELETVELLSHEPINTESQDNQTYSGLTQAHSLVSFAPTAAAIPAIPPPAILPPATTPPPSTTTPTHQSFPSQSQRLLITGIRSNRGPVKVAIYKTASYFPNLSAASQTMVLPADQTEIETALNLSGEFAVAVYQDINSDGELNRSRLGVPVEPFAFSNNAMGRRGPPTFEQAMVVAPANANTPLDVIVNLP